MDKPENIYQPHFTCDDLLHDESNLPAYDSRSWTGVHWTAWKHLGQNDSIEHKSTQTDPCIWNEEQLEALRCCKIEMAKYIGQLESLCAEQRQRIDDLERRCIAHNVVISKWSRLKPMKHDKLTSTEELEFEMKQKLVGSQAERDALRKELKESENQLKLCESKNLKLRFEVDELHRTVADLKDNFSEKERILIAVLSCTRRQLQMKEISYRETYKLVKQLGQHLHQSSLSGSKMFSNFSETVKRHDINDSLYFTVPQSN
ncbi:unnamed protein product [Echinostoma caproni]|uniref:Coiled-coil domain-containing protein 160 n=1 Tax=Echinostoma caproni TaxID=27848 RepID=A0A183A5L6_9TREM|nr:unnamed protein product [Echinostoma caproni]